MSIKILQIIPADGWYKKHEQINDGITEYFYAKVTCLALVECNGENDIIHVEMDSYGICPDFDPSSLQGEIVYSPQHNLESLGFCNEKDWRETLSKISSKYDWMKGAI